MKKALSILLTGALALGLSACNPPLPPEVRAALEEQIIVCEQGESAIILPGAAVEQASLWNDSLSFDCPEMVLSDAADFESANLVAGLESDSALLANAYAQVPFAVDAAVFLINSVDMGSVALSPKSIDGIFSGSISNWSDPQLVEDNPNNNMPDLEIVLVPQTSKKALEAMQTWMTRLLGKALDVSALEISEELSVDALYEIPDGGIMLAPYSLNYEPAWMTANIVLDVATEKIAEGATGNFASAATQWEYQESGSVAGVKLNPELPALPPQGIDTAPEPYQAIFPVNIALVGADELIHRANLRYLLRAASQSTLTGFNYVELPNNIRFKIIDFISTGLTVPELDPALLEGQ